MKGILGAIAISVGWLAVTYRGAGLLRKRRGPEAWALWFALIALSIAATLFHPDVYRAFDRAAGEPNLAQYVGHCFILIAAWQAHAMLLFLVYDGRGAVRKVLINGALVVAVLSAVGVLFALAPVGVESTQFTRDYAEAPYITAYWLSYLVGVNYLLVGLVRLVSRYAKLCNQDWLRLGLRLVAAGGVFGIAYWCHWMAYLLLRKADLAIPTALNAIGYLTAPAAVILVVVGSTLPAVGPRTHLPSHPPGAGLFDLPEALPTVVGSYWCGTRDCAAGASTRPGRRYPPGAPLVLSPVQAGGGDSRQPPRPGSSADIDRSRPGSRDLRRCRCEANQKGAAAMRRGPTGRPALCAVAGTGI